MVGPDHRGSDRRTSRLAALADRLVAAGAPGAAVVVLDADGIDEAASGVADRESGRSMQPFLHFRAGSVTKTFVATLVMSLVAERKLALPDTIEHWLPGVLPYAQEATIRQLLNHTSGIPNNSDVLSNIWHGSSGDRFRRRTPHELVSMVVDRQPVAPPGSTWSYSNVGYVILGLIIEAATDSTLESELARAIFEPLKLVDSTFPVDTVGLPDPSSKGYSYPISSQPLTVDSQLVDYTLQHPSMTWAAGAIISSLPDVCRFLRMLLGGRLLPERLVGEMLTTVDVPAEALPLPLFQRNGLGLIELDSPHGALLGSAGGIPGFFNMVISSPDARRQGGMMINVGERVPEPIVASFLDGLRELASIVGS